MADAAPRTEEELEERLSRPTNGVRKMLRQVSGDILILGVGGKMGPTLAQMARRACDEMNDGRNVIGVARFSDERTRQKLEQRGVQTIVSDLLDSDAVNALPDAPNVLYLAGQKFGTTDAPERTWAMNTVVPQFVAQKYRKSHIVVFSTGCVYANTLIDSGGSIETDPLEPVGEYANSCVGRERVFGWFAQKYGTQALFFRLNYAIDLRYGVLLDIAQKVFRGVPVNVSTGYVNVIWQGDANTAALECLAHTQNPPVPLNMTGQETLSVRTLAHEFGERFGRDAIIEGTENPTALLSNAAKAHALLDAPTVSLAQMLDWTADWVRHGGTTLNKPTHFDAPDGRY
jgi:nucleoside-diphosphate-sugar epimerase